MWRGVRPNLLASIWHKFLPSGLPEATLGLRPSGAPPLTSPGIRLHEFDGSVRQSLAFDKQPRHDRYFNSPSHSASAMFCRWASCSRSAASCLLERNEASVRALGIRAPISTTKGACLTPRSPFVILSQLTNDACMFLASSRDWSRFLLRAMTLIKCGNSDMDG